MQNINSFNIFVEGKLQIIQIFHNCDKLCNLSAIYMRFYRGIKVKYSATHAKFNVALTYKINPVQITTIIAENTEKSLNLVPHTIESSIQICEKFSPIVKLNWHFSQVPWLLLHQYC